MDLPTEIHLQAPGLRRVITTVEQAVDMIDRRMPPELARLPRWTFARALLIEALRTQKSRDMATAVRQLQQALSNEKWLSKEPKAPKKPKESKES
jgi:hypothetical protein